MSAPEGKREARLDRFGAALEARRQTQDIGKKDPSP
jgi:hypothetical protein